MVVNNIFLSYSRKDTVFMRRLYEDLCGAGFSVLIDDAGLKPGTPENANTLTARPNTYRLFNRYDEALQCSR